jgi:hypothetical protein
MPAFNGITSCPLTVRGNTTSSTKPHHYEVVVLTGADTLADSSFSIHNSLSEVSKVNVTGLTVSSETPLGSSGLKFKMAEGPYITGIKYIIKLEATAGNTSAALCSKVVSVLSQVSTIRNNQLNTSFSVSLAARPKLESKAAGAGLPADLRYTFAELLTEAIRYNNTLDATNTAQYNADSYIAAVASINASLLTNDSIRLGRCYFEVNGIKNYLIGGLGLEKDYNLTPPPGTAAVINFTTDVEYGSGSILGTDMCRLHGFSSPDTYGLGKFIINHATDNSYPPCETTGNFGSGNGSDTTSPAFIYFECSAIPSPNPVGYKGRVSVKLLAVPY